MPKEQQPTLQSPLAHLVKSGTMRQEPLPGLERFAPRDSSRFSVKRIAFTLRRGTETIKAVLGRDGSQGHFLKTEHQASGSSSTLFWSEGDNKKMVVSAEIPGNATITTENKSVVLTAETGASITYHASGAFAYSPTPLRRERLSKAQADVPWWDKAREVIENEYIYEAGSVVTDPLYGESEKKGTPYKRFEIAIPISEIETKTFDVYAYGQAIALLTRRNIHAQDNVRLRASVQFHEQRLPQGKSTVVPWLRLFDVQKIK